MKKLFSILFVFMSVFVNGQKAPRNTRAEYIDAYKEIAMQEMRKTGIPASITLAQGILESGDGNSRLARKSNNHFGIKCHDWKGKSVRHDDDAKNECFRKYKSVEESFHDHSEFLTSRQRYSALFDLKPTDYRAWAKGLKKAGYATSPTYSKALIGLIEDNELHKYDQLVIAEKKSNKKRTETAYEEYTGGRKVFYNNRVKYILAKAGDSFASLSIELDLLSWQLPKYNDLSEENVIQEGQYIYLQPKRNKADARKNYHVVAEGETIQSISQLYAVKAEKLAGRNGLPTEGPLEPGQSLLLRKRLKNVERPLSLPEIELKETETTEEFQVEYDLDS